MTNLPGTRDAGMPLPPSSFSHLCLGHGLNLTRGGVAGAGQPPIPHPGVGAVLGSRRATPGLKYQGNIRFYNGFSRIGVPRIPIPTEMSRKHKFHKGLEQFRDPEEPTFSSDMKEPQGFIRDLSQIGVPRTPTPNKIPRKHKVL